MYDTINKGAYSYAMGDASVAFSKGASSVFINPAGLGKSSFVSITTTHQNIFGVKDLYNEMLAFNFPLPFVRMGIGTNQLILLNQYSEQVYYISGASIIRIIKIPIYFGISTKILHSSVNYAGANKPISFNLDFGIIADLNKNLSFGFVMKNPVKNKIVFLKYENTTKTSYEIGAAYNWKNVMNFTADYQIKNKIGKFKFGWELWFYNVFAPRIGLNGENLTAGFGLKSKRWALDGAILSHDSLGSDYKISFTYKFK